MTPVDNAQGDKGPADLPLIFDKKREEGHVVSGGGEGEEESENALCVGKVEEELGCTGLSIRTSRAGAVFFEGVEAIQGTADWAGVFVEGSGRGRGVDFAGDLREDFARFELKAVRKDLDVGGEVLGEEVVENVFDCGQVFHEYLLFG